MSRPNKYFYCFVPDCGNTSKSSNLLFFPVPKGDRRTEWCKAVGRLPASLSLTTPHRCCQIHFKLEDDVKNWIYYKALMDAGVENVPCLKLKPDVVPHRYLTKEDDCTSTMTFYVQDVQTGDSCENLQESLPKISGKKKSPSKPSIHEDLQTSDSCENIQEDLPKISGKKNTSPSKPSINEDSEMNELHENSHEDLSNIIEETNTPPMKTFVLKATKRKNKGVQVCISKQSKTRCTQTDVFYESSGNWTVTTNDQPRAAKRQRAAEETAESTTEATRNKRRRTIKRPRRFEEQIAGSESEVEVKSQTSDSSYKPSSQSFHAESSQETYEELLTLQLKTQLPSLNISLMERYPKRYLGIPKDKLGLIDVFVRHTGSKKIDILRTLRKIRKNESYADLADVFGVSKSVISDSIRKVVPLLAALLVTFIFWPPSKCIKNNLPVAFRINYADVESIIDCFEVHIPKPTNPVIQALTWSEYKHDNTIKYLISITPAGFITFISKGFGGRATDVEVVKKSGYLDLLRPGMKVMADRGFKQIASLLEERQCALAKPPSVYAGKKLAKDEVKLAKIVASLRINVERLIKRIREFSLFNTPPLSQGLFSIADQAVIIACALANIQGPIYH